MTHFFVEPSTTDMCQQHHDIAHRATFKSCVRRQGCRSTAQQILATHSAVGTMVVRLELKSKLPPYLDLALKEVHTEARVDSAWKHLSP